MSQQLRVEFKWLTGCLIGASLLGACAGPEQEESAQADGSALVQGAQAVRESRGEELSGLTAQLSAERTSFGAQEDVLVTITLRNEGSRPVQLLRWNTPAEGLEEALLELTRDGQPVSFEGPHYKRPAPRGSDLIRLAPGQHLSRTVKLTGVYDLSRTGVYTLRYAGLKSNELTVWIEGRSTVSAQAKPGAVCSTTQQSTLAQALSAASGMANDSVSYLNGSPSATPRYTTWFGAFSTSGWSTAKSHFVAIKDAIDTKPITFDCSCKQNYYAYVYPNQPYKIYLCSVFWNAPMTGTDSKGGTLIHELSHFTVVAGTDDYAYGQSAAKSLAISDPSKALDNADNHEYFAENTPFLQ